MSINNFFDKRFRLIFLFIILAEIISFAGYLFPAINAPAFFIIILLALALSLYRLEYGLAILLAELFIGSKGYLFYFTSNGLTISLRIALWLIIISVWLGQTINSWIKNKKLEINFCHSSYFSYFVILFLFIFWGIINGWLNHNEPSNLFFDFNSWLYFALIFPFFSGFNKPERLKLLGQVFVAATVWLSIKTLFLVFTFSHNFIIALFGLYPWIRDSGVGEITQVQGGFWRVFFQSHIFVLLGFFLSSMIMAKLIVEKIWRKYLKFYIFNFIFLILFLTTILASFSRSFWLGLAAGVLIAWLIWLALEKIKFKDFVLINSYWLGVALISFALLIAIVKFPYPAPLGGFAPVDLLSTRASQLADEAGVASRWALLPNLWSKIKAAPLLGQGFGATVTYKTNDPRVLQTNPSGDFTTYAFEWGWLDIWLKLGLFGLLAYLTIIAKIFWQAWQPTPLAHTRWLIQGLAIGLAVVAAVSVFSPYTNHPLGIGYLIIASVLIDRFYIAKTPLA